MLPGITAIVGGGPSFTAYIEGQNFWTASSGQTGVCPINAVIIGGVAPYSFAWSGFNTEGIDLVFVPQDQYTEVRTADRNSTGFVSLTITDAVGSVVSGLSWTISGGV